MNTWELRKKANWYDNRAKFNQAEVKALNIEAYDLGAGHVMEATAEIYGMGQKRLDEAKEALERVSHLELYDYSEKFSLFNLRRFYTKIEARQMIYGAYRLGVEHSREAIGYAYRLGEKRLARIDAKLRELQKLDLPDRGKNGNIYEARLNRDTRRAKNPSKKGAVLNEQHDD